VLQKCELRSRVQAISDSWRALSKEGPVTYATLPKTRFRVKLSSHRR
jgi:hypothetical protein